MRRRPTRMIAALVAASLISGTTVAPAQAQPLSSNVTIEQLLPENLRNNPALLAFGALSGVGVLAALIVLLSGNAGSSEAPVKPAPTTTPGTTAPSTTQAPTTAPVTTAPTTAPTVTSTQKPTSTPTKTPIVTATPTVTVTPAAGMPADLTAAINDYRAAQNLGTLAYDAQLQQLAQSYAQRAADSGTLVKPTENVGGYYTQQSAGVTAAGVMEYGKSTNNLSGISNSGLKKIGVGTVEKDGKVWIYVLTSF